MSLIEREPKPPLITEPEGRFSLPTRVFKRKGIGFVINHTVILYQEESPPVSKLYPGQVRISMPATIDGERIGWWSGVYEEPVAGDSDYPGIPRDVPFGD